MQKLELSQGRTEMRLSALSLAFMLLCGHAVFAQDSTPQSESRYCTFQDGSQVTVRYSNAEPPTKRETPPLGKVWTPGDVPMLLFVESPIILNGSEIATGAYSLYVIPDKQKWTLIVNKNVTAGASYDEKQDLARGPMEIGKLPQATDKPQLSFNHVAPRQCSLRVDYGKTGAWADFKQK